MDIFVQYLPIIAIFALMIGLTVWQQKKQKKRMEELNESIRTGIKVRTAGGFLGTVVGVNPDTVYVELDPDKIKVELMKGAVAPLDNQGSAFPPEEDKKEELNESASKDDVKEEETSGNE